MNDSVPMGTISEPTIVEISEIPCLMVRRVVRMEDIPAHYDSSYQKIFSLLGQRGVAPTAPPLGISFSMPSEKLDLGAAVPVPTNTGGEGDVEYFVVPGGTAIKVTLTGSFEMLPLAYGTIQEWSDAHSVERGELAWEQYMIMPTPESDPAENITDVYWLIRA